MSPAGVSGAGEGTGGCFYDWSAREMTKPLDEDLKFLKAACKILDKLPIERRKSIDEDLKFLKAACKILDKLPIERRKSILRYLWDRYVTHRQDALLPENKALKTETKK
jgi:hypothetical protein